MAITDHVSISIAADSVSAARLGFGVPGILSCNAAFPERSRTYTSLAGLASDGFATTSPEYLAMASCFAQKPRPPRAKVLRAVGAPTQRYTITPTVADSTVYAIHVKGEGITAETVSITSGVGATATTISDALRTALDAVVGENYALSGTTTVVVTGDAAGDWFSLEVDDTSRLSIIQDHAEPATALATDLNDITNEDDEWYWLVTLYNSEAYVLAAAAWVESAGTPKFYVTQTSSTEDILLAASGANGPLDNLANQAYERTAGFYHPDPSEFADAALVGNLAPRVVGTWTAKFKRLSGVATVTLTPTQRGRLIDRNANSYETVAGVPIVFEGTTAAGPSVVRGFIDETVALDWVQDDMSAGIFEAMAGADKIPRTNEGMVVIEAAIRATLDRAVDRGIAAELGPDEEDGPSPNVEIPDVADMDDLLPRGVRAAFSFKLAGAIHTADPVTGVVTL